MGHDFIDHIMVLCLLEVIDIATWIMPPTLILFHELDTFPLNYKASGFGRADASYLKKLIFLLFFWCSEFSGMKGPYARGTSWPRREMAPHVALFLVLCLVHCDTKTVMQDKLGEWKLVYKCQWDVMKWRHLHIIGYQNWVNWIGSIEYYRTQLRKQKLSKLCALLTKFLVLIMNNCYRILKIKLLVKLLPC